MKRINITTGILLIYLLVMGVIGWPGNDPQRNYLEYFSIIGLSLGAIIFLRYIQIKRMKLRNKRKEENKRK